MAKLYATLETSKGKTVSVSDNQQITATLYDGNLKAYSVHIEWTNIGDIIDDDGNDLPDTLKTKGAIVTTREWRNQPDENRQKSDKRFCSNCGYVEAQTTVNCKKCMSKLNYRI